MTVPAVVPSVFQSSTPDVPSLATKKMKPFAALKLAGLEPPEPGLMSLTITVPAGVPSLFQISTPWTPFEARKNTEPFNALVDASLVNSDGSLPPLPTLMSLTSRVRWSAAAMRAEDATRRIAVQAHKRLRGSESIGSD
jgi:hypothetical protein